jgi:hypothetical protein
VPLPLAIAERSIAVVSNGENVDDSSGNSGSTAGDVNGDGLNDLIVGARGKLKAGKFYVIFGKKDNTTIDHLSHHR